MHQKLKTPPDALEVARRVISAEVFGMRLLADSLGPSFEDCVSRLQEIPGRIILSGIGKSGHIARKIGATLASTGTPAQFVHPTDASHGDLGMITEDDAVIAFSKSGQTRELGDLTGYCLRLRRHAGRRHREAGQPARPGRDRGAGTSRSPGGLRRDPRTDHIVRHDAGAR